MKRTSWVSRSHHKTNAKAIYYSRNLGWKKASFFERTNEPEDAKRRDAQEILSNSILFSVESQESSKPVLRWFFRFMKNLLSAFVIYLIIMYNVSKVRRFTPHAVAAGNVHVSISYIFIV